MSSPIVTPPGWYPNAQGELQWWDGATWGALAHNQTQTATALHNTHKPAVSRLVSIAYTLSGLALIFLVVSISITLTETQTYLEVVKGERPMPAETWADAVSRVAGYSAPVLALASVVCAIIGLIRSRQKRSGVFALIFSCVVLFSPVLLSILGMMLWFGTGIFMQLTGGTYG